MIGPFDVIANLIEEIPRRSKSHRSKGLPREYSDYPASMPGRDGEPNPDHDERRYMVICAVLWMFTIAAVVLATLTPIIAYNLFGGWGTVAGFAVIALALLWLGTRLALQTDPERKDTAGMEDSK